MIYGYIRVSTDKQDCDNQKLCIESKAQTLGVKIDKYIEDAGVSGTVKAKNRNLWKIVKCGKKGDWLITSELSRLGRSTIDVLKTCDILAQKGVNVWFVKQNIGLDQTPMGKMMLAIMSAFAEMERDLISLRTREALARIKAEGRTIGRKTGSKNKHNKLEGKEDILKKLLEQDIPQTVIAKKMKISCPTLRKYIKNNFLI